MEQYMSKTRMDYGSGVARPKIKEKDSFELNGQFLKELRENTFSGSDNEDANKHIEKVLKIVDLFHVPNITVDQLMLRVFPISLTGAASFWIVDYHLTQVTVKHNDIKIDLSKEFLVELRKNMYHGTHYEDVVDHIAKLLKMVDLIYVPRVDSHQLRMIVFPLSLADDAKERWISDGDEKITTWEELVEKFFFRFYHESYDREMKCWTKERIGRLIHLNSYQT
ncbi:hypothetical protein Tco_0053072 [Tanacetum coccineum]